MRRARLYAASLGAALAATVAPRDAAANPPDTYGFGSRETAMGGAAAASTRGFAATHYNPAALARSRGVELSIGYFRAHHHMNINGRDTGVDPVKGLNGGLVLPGTLFQIPFAFGIALHLPDDRLSRVRALRQEQPRWEMYDNRNQRLFFAACVAIEPFPWLQLGGGLSFMSSTQGRLDISGRANVFRADDSELRHEVDADLTAIRYPHAGVRVALSDKAALAVVYRGEFQLGLDLSARLAGSISDLTTALFLLETSSVNNFLPQQVVLGGEWKPHPDVTATFDATWMQWSAYVPPVARLNVGLDIPPPDGGWPPTVTPPEVPAPTRVAPLRMHDRLVPRLGFEWRAVHARKTDVFARAGYEIFVSPIEAQSGLTNYIDRSRHTLSAGAGLALRGLMHELPATVTLDAHGQLGQLVTATTQKTSAADLVGDYTAGGRFVSVGVSLGVVFDPPKGKK